MKCYCLELRARLSVVLIAIALIAAASSSAFAQTSTVSWDRNGDGVTAGYMLSYGTQSGSYSTTVDVGNVVSYPVTLVPGNTYYLSVRAYNASREYGPASGEASVVIPALPTRPTATITGTLGASGTASVTWSTTNATAVTVNGAGVALNATASFPITQTTTYTVVATGPGGSTTASTTVVVPRVDCQMSGWTFTSATAWSACTSGQRTRNETWNRTITTQPSGGGAACGVTQEVRAVSEPCAAAPTAQLTAVAGSTPGTARVTWQSTNATTATLNGAAVATSGTTQFNISATTTYTLVVTGPGGSATSSGTVVVPRVDCQMSGWTFTSATAWSACTSGQRTRNETWNRSITTQPSGGGAACGVTQEVRVASEPCTVAATPTAQLTAVAGTTPGTAKVSWQSTNATAATLNGVAVATSGTAQFNITGTTTYTLVVTGPGGTASAAGTVVVAAPVDCVVSTWSLQSASPWGACTGGQQTRTETWGRSIITPASNGGAACGILQEQRTAAQACTDQTPTAPGMPTSFKAAISGNNVTLGWNVPAAGGAPKGYRIWVGASTTWELVNGADVGNVLNANGSLGAGTYYARVAAYNAVGTSAPTQISFRVGAKKKPSRPAGFTASLEASVAVLSWSAPAGDDPDSPTGYVIEAGSASGLSDVAVVPLGNQSSYQAAVPPGTYFVRVRAINDLGAGEASTEVVLRYGAGPGAPGALTETGGGPIVRLSWHAPTTGELPGSYTIEAGSAPGLADLAVLRAGNVNSFMTTAPAGTYYVRVRAVGANGVAGDASNEVVVVRR